MNIKNLFDDLEKVKKELWHLIKKVIPHLEELLNNTTAQEIASIKTQLALQVENIESLEDSIGQIEQSLSSQENSITSLNNSISSLSSQATQLSSSLQTLSAQVDAHGTSISTINSTLTSISDTVEDNTVALSTANSNISALQTSINQISSIVDQHSGSILSMSVDLGTVSNTAEEAYSLATSVNTSLSNLSSTVASNVGKVSVLESDVSTLESSTTALQTSVDGLTSSVNTLSSALSSLENQIANLPTEQTEVIYDMDSTDASINHGYTSGMSGGNYIDQDYSIYRKIRVYARLYNANCVQEFAVKNRKYVDMTLVAASPTPTVLSFLKMQMNLEPYLSRLQVMAYARYVFSNSTGTFTLDYGLSTNTFYVYRIEGIK